MQISELSFYDVSQKIITIIEKIEEVIDKLIVKIKERNTNIKKYKNLLLQNANSLNDIEIEIFNYESNGAKLITIDFDNLDPILINNQINRLKKYEANLSSRVITTNIGNIGGIRGLLDKQEDNLKEYLELKRHLRGIKRHINSLFYANNITILGHNYLIKLFNAYKRLLITINVSSYKYNNEAISKAINSARKLNKG